MEEPVIDEPVEAVVEEAPVEAAPEAPPAWSGPSQEEWQTVTQSLQHLSQQFAPPAAPEPPGVESYFPVDPETGEANLTYEALERFVSDRANQLVEQRLGTYEPILNQTVADRGEQLINQHFDRLAQSGEFDRGLARELAEGYVSSGISPDEAIKRGAERARDFAQAQRSAGVEEYKTTLQNIGNAPREPGVNGAAVMNDAELDLKGMSSADAYKTLADRWTARHRL